MDDSTYGNCKRHKLIIRHPVSKKKYREKGKKTTGSCLQIKMFSRLSELKTTVCMNINNKLLKTCSGSVKMIACLKCH